MTPLGIAQSTRGGETIRSSADGEELTVIRDGALSYDELMETATALQAKMEGAAGESVLPVDVDYARVDRLVFELVTMDVT